MQMKHNIFVLCFLSLVATSKARFQWTSWSSPSSCSTTCGQGIVTKIRECKPVDESSAQEGDDDCLGPATIEEACFMPPCRAPDGTTNCNCGCKLTADHGRIISKLTRKQSLCQWSIVTKPGSSIVLTINWMRNVDWKSSGLYISGNERAHTFTEQYGGKMRRTFPIVIYTRGNVMNVTLHYLKLQTGTDFMEMEASYTVNQEEEESKDDDPGFTLNMSAIAGIAACAFIIVVASIIMACRRIRNTSNTETKEQEKVEEGFEDNCSSTSGSNRSTFRNQKSSSTHSNGGKPCYSTPYSTGTLSAEERERLLAAQNNDPFFQQENGSIVSGLPPTSYVPSGQGFVNWPVQHGQIIQPTVQMYPGQTHPVTVQQIPQPALDYMIKQTQLNYARQMTYAPSTAGSYEYVTSAGEG